MPNLLAGARCAKRLGLPMFAVIATANAPFGKTSIVALTTHPDRIMDLLAEQDGIHDVAITCQMSRSDWRVAQDYAKKGDPLFALVRSNLDGSEPYVEQFFDEVGCHRVANAVNPFPESFGYKNSVIAVDLEVFA